MSLQRTAYVSFSGKSNGMLALWIDHQPSCNEEQRDPDGWITNVDQATDYVIERLCEVSRCSGAKVIKVPEYAAEWWERIDSARKRKAKAAERARLKDAQSLIPIDPEVEREGRDAAFVRARLKTKRKRVA